MIHDLVVRNRSYRRFYQDASISRDTLVELVDLARLSASAGNKQPLKYMISCDAGRNADIFATLAWAASLKDWPGPSEGERPSGYIVILEDTQISNPYVRFDVGIAAQSMLLGATEQGLGGCMIASVQRERLRRIMAITEHLEIVLVVALGKPKEEVVIVDVPPSGDATYWRDDRGVHHVPKRSLDEVLIG